METSLRKRAEAAVAQRLHSIKGETVFRSEPYRWHTREPVENLVPGVTREDFWDDLKDGNGNELLDSPQAPAKFCAAYSSAALAVNIFGPFRHSPGNLMLAGHVDFSESRFERKCPTPLSGPPPNLDFFAAGPKTLVAVESKFLETIDRPKVSFSPRYETVIQTLAEPGWQDTYRALLDDPSKFTHLDAAQLVKHYLGVRHTFRDCRVTKVLLYLFWEPTNAAHIPEYRKHRQEVELFATGVEGSEIRFLPLSYSEMLQEWSKTSGWGGMLAHIQALRQRYELSI